jgi:hypothetical protein
MPVTERHVDWSSFMPPVARRWLKVFLGLTVGVGVGLAPFYGAKAVPAFSPLLGLFPLDLRNTIIPLSGFLMGIIVAGVQYASYRKTSRKTLTRWFKGSMIVFLVSFVLLVFAYFLLVARVEVIQESKPETFAVVTGSLTVPARPLASRCTCEVGEPADVCVADISLNPLHVRSCFGTIRVAVSTLILSFLYLFVTSAFAVVVALLVLTDLGHARTQ